MRIMRDVGGIAAAALAALCIGCGDKAVEPPGASTGESPAATATAGEPPTSATAGDGDAPKAPVDTGIIEGTVAFSGDAPVMAPLKRLGDPFCSKTEATDTSVLVNDNGTLANVVVRLKPGAAKGPLPEEPVVIAQSNCMYQPRIAAAMVGQAIQFTNSDKTMHNIHATDSAAGYARSTFNLVQPPGAPALSRPAVGPGPIEVKCDVHPWMRAYVMVSDHPYFATTRGDGAFRIEGVPVGTYELEAWHEVYGTKTATVEVGKDASATVKFSYDASEKQKQ